MGATARQIQADDTRRRLFAAAVQLFAMHGYHATTVDAIAKRVGVAKGTFFVHFATKDAVIVELVRRQVAAAREARAAQLAYGRSAALRATTLALAEQAEQSRELSRAVLAATLDSPAVKTEGDALFGTVLGDMLEDASAMTWRRGVEPERVAHSLMALYLGAVFHFTSSREGESLVAMLSPMVDALIVSFQETPHHAYRLPRRSRRR